MLAQFRRADAPDDVLGSARWNGGAIEVGADDDSVKRDIERIFRRTAVVTDDASYRRQGTHGEVVVQPGSLEWFRAAAFARAPAFDLVARLVPEVNEGGWDPAAQYRRFGESIERLEDST
jgi:hypothetical protein